MNPAPEQATTDLRTLGRYELIHRIGVGGMAEVFLARQRGFMNFRKLVVVKTIHPTLAGDPEFINMLLDEARLAALIKHPRVVDIYDLGKEGKTYFLAMEYLAGKPLTDVIRAGIKKRKLDIHSCARIIADAAEGLQAAHELKSHAGETLDFVHRDVSPGNIIVLYDGQVKLVDFGVSKARGRLQKTAVQTVKGKLGYASPEQLENREVDHRSDIFSLGVCMWELLTHRRLWQADTVEAVLRMIRNGRAKPPSLVRPDCPRDLDEICLKALQLRPGDRYQSARDMQTELESFLRIENYYRESRAIEKYMAAMFSEDREAEEDLVRRVAEASRQITLPVEADVGTMEPEGDTEPLGLRRQDTEKDTEEEPDPDARTQVRHQPVPTPRSDSSPAAPPSSRTSPAIELVDEITEPARRPPSAPGAGAAPKAPASGAETARIRPVGSSSDETELVSFQLPSPEDQKRRYAWLAVGSLGLLAVLIIAVIASGGDQELTKAGPAGTASSELSVPEAAAKSALADHEEPDVAEHQGPDVAEPEPVLELDGQSPVLTGTEPETDGDGSEPHEDAPEPEREPEEAPEPELSFQPDQVSTAKPDVKPPSRQGPPPRRRAQRARAKRQPPPRRAISPARAREVYHEGFRLFVRGSVAEADSKFREALRLDPTFALPYRGLGMVAEKRGQRQRAIRAFRAYLRRAPGASDAGQIKQRIERLGG